MGFRLAYSFHNSLYTKKSIVLIRAFRVRVGCDAPIPFLILILLALWSGTIKAQDQCGPTENKKALKLLEQSQNSKKHNARERYNLIQQAIEEDPECVECYFALGEASFGRARMGEGSYNIPIKYFTEVAQRCANYHSDVFYYLGVSYYAGQDFENAFEHFTAFIEFPDEPEKMARDYDRKYEDVMEILPEVEFYAEFLNNPVPFNPVIVAGVSSQWDEYLPMLSPDNLLLFYTRKLEKKSKGDLYVRQVEEFTISRRQAPNGDFDNGTPMPAPFNVGDNYGGVTLSIDNREMIITVCRPGRQGYNNCDLYSTTYTKMYNERTGKEEYMWSGLENLGPNVNTEDGWEAQPSLSADGKTLYFASARENSTPDVDGNPTIDIYYSIRGEDGTWGVAKNLGSQINTSGHEKSPFMHTDSKTLYYSATGRPGAGGYDIYYTRQLEDNSWSVPKNIGIPINTPDDEHGLIVSTDGKKAYYASKGIRGARGLDIVSFDVPEKARPEKIMLIKGEMRDDNGQVVAGAKVALHYAESKRIERVPVNEESGNYVAVVNVEHEDVVLTIEKEGHAFEARVYTKEDAEKNHGVAEVKSEIKPLKVGEPYTLHDIYYATSSAEIDPKSRLVLQQFGQYLKNNPRMKVEIVGHTDSRGDRQMNMTLSKERAFEVKKYLEAQGVTGTHLLFRGEGPNSPIADNNTEEGRAKNRRTEFIVISQ